MESTLKKNAYYLLPAVELVYRPKFKISTRPVIKQSSDAYKLLLQIWDMDQIQLKEESNMLLFNSTHRLLGVHELSSGGISGTVTDPRLIFAVALKANASVIMLAHNHPSGDLKPSTNDISLTQKIRQAGMYLEINVLDHLIISSEGYLSMADEGLI